MEYVKRDTMREVGQWIVEDLPIYSIKNQAGDFSSISKYLLQNLKYPLNAIKDSIEGNVFAQICIEKTGDIVDIKIIKGICDDIDKEAIRLLKMLTCKKAAYTRGKPVYYCDNVVLPFRLSRSKIGLHKRSKSENHK